MSEVQPGNPDGLRSALLETRFDGLLSSLLAIRGVEAAAIVGTDGEFLQGTAADERLLERMVGTVTSALAAGEALAGLLENPEGRAGDTEPGSEPVLEVPANPAVEVEEERAARHQLMVMFQDGGPILFTPLAGGARLAVVAVRSSHDIGRVRFQLRSLGAESA